MAPSTYHEHQARQADPQRLPRRARGDQALRAKIRAVWDANWQVYGARKVWRALGRQGETVTSSPGVERPCF